MQNQVIREMTKEEIEIENKKIIEKLTSVIYELGFMEANCPNEVELEDGIEDCTCDDSCLDCWIKALEIKQDK